METLPGVGCRPARRRALFHYPASSRLEGWHPPRQLQLSSCAPRPAQRRRRRSRRPNQSSTPTSMKRGCRRVIESKGPLKIRRSRPRAECLSHGGLVFHPPDPWPRSHTEAQVGPGVIPRDGGNQLLRDQPLRNIFGVLEFDAIAVRFSRPPSGFHVKEERAFRLSGAEAELRSEPGPSRPCAGNTLAAIFSVISG